MDIVDMIAGAQGGRGLQSLAERFGLSEDQARAAVDRLSPTIMAGIRRGTKSPDGLSSLLSALVAGNHGRYLDGNDDDIVEDGNQILGHLFGSKEVSRAVAARASEETGIGSDILKKMLPVISAMIMGGVSKNALASGGQGGLGDMLGQFLGGGEPAAGGIGDRLAAGVSGGTKTAGGGLGNVLRQRLDSGRRADASEKRGIRDALDGVFGQKAQPEVRERVSRNVEDTLGSLLGRGTPQGDAADDFLGSLLNRLR